MQVAFDSFQRASYPTTGWGTGTDGQTWASAGSYVYSVVSPGEGKLTGATSSSVATYGSKTTADAELLVRLQASATTAAIGVACRYQNSSNNYRVRINITNIALVKNVAGVTTTLFTGTLPYTFTANTPYWVRAKVNGTTFWAKTWADGQPEPTVWQINGVTDSQFTSAGNIGLFFNMQNAADSALFDNFAVSDYSTGDTGAASDMVIPINTGGAAITPNPYGYTAFHSAANIDAKLPQILADMKAQGVSTLRYQVRWALIDTVADGTQNPTTYTWKGLDDLVFQCKTAGIYLQYTIQMAPHAYYTTPIVEAGTPYTYLPDPNKTATFASQVASRYNGVTNVPNYGPMLLPSIEIGNEDYDLFANPQAARDNGGKYLAAAMIASYIAIKAVSPTCLVGTGALLSQDITTHVQTWLGGLFTGGAGPYLSYLNFHWYKNGGTYPVGQSPEDGTTGFTAYYQTIQSVAASYGYNLPVWVTEAGYDAPNAANPPGTVGINTDAAHQWQYLQQELDESRQSGVITHLFIYTLGDDNTKSLTQGGQVDNFAPLKSKVNPAYDGLTAYIQQYTQWTNIPTTVLLPPAVRRDGVMGVTPRRDGFVPADKRRG